MQDLKDLKKPEIKTDCCDVMTTEVGSKLKCKKCKKDVTVEILMKVYKILYN